jgi:hypothetical protein
MKCWFLLALLFLLPASCPVAEDLFEIKPVADGVYAAIAKPISESITAVNALRSRSDTFVNRLLYGGSVPF